MFVLISLNHNPHQMTDEIFTAQGEIILMWSLMAIIICFISAITPGQCHYIYSLSGPNWLLGWGQFLTYPVLAYYLVKRLFSGYQTYA